MEAPDKGRVSWTSGFLGFSVMYVYKCSNCVKWDEMMRSRVFIGSNFFNF
jgi:hypothetical protein